MQSISGGGGCGRKQFSPWSPVSISFKFFGMIASTPSFTDQYMSKNIRCKNYVF